MTDLNNVNLVGRLTRDVEVKYTKSGVAVGNFCLAVNRLKKTETGFEDVVSFIECTILGKACEAKRPYLTKGKQCVVQGYLQQDRWEKDGQKYSKLGVVVDMVQFFGSVKDGQGSDRVFVSAEPEIPQPETTDAGFPSNEEVPF